MDSIAQATVKTGGDLGNLAFKTSPYADRKSRDLI
jgi:hypothetical protein